ncbi:MAG: thiamine-phosphate kinase [Planctomycetota bacterium]
MERSFLAYLRGRTRNLPQVEVGIGDDAAVIGSSEPLIVCTDQIIDKVDFETSAQSLSDIGYKSIAINLSDLAAMGAVPTSALVVLSLPEENSTQIAGDVYEGILEAAEAFGFAIAGGDLSTYDGPLSITVTLIGNIPSNDSQVDSKPWLRSGAEEGDVLMATGAFGGSLFERHLRPVPRIELAQRLRQLATVHAAIDVSDGFSLDLDRLCAASGVGVELDVDAIPVHSDAISMSAKTGRKPFEHAWSDGEDFELLFTVSEKDAEILAAAELPATVTKIGTIIGRTGLWKMSGSKYTRLSPQGYQHL